MEAASVVRMDLEQTVSVKGTVEGTDSAEVYSGSQRRITEILVKEGDRVHNGENLARLEDDSSTVNYEKALGARTKDILSQFLIEAVILSCIGGIIGIGLGIGVAGIAATVLDAKLVVSTSSIIASVTFSVAVGIIFGLFPAKKAAKMNPIDALRYE